MRIQVAVIALASLIAAGTARAQDIAASGSLVTAFADEPNTLDPVRHSAGVDTYGIVEVFEQLTRLDPSGKRR